MGNLGSLSRGVPGAGAGSESFYPASRRAPRGLTASDERAALGAGRPSSEAPPPRKQSGSRSSESLLPAREARTASLSLSHHRCIAHNSDGSRERHECDRKRVFIRSGVAQPPRRRTSQRDEARGVPVRFRSGGRTGCSILSAGRDRRAWWRRSEEPRWAGRTHPSLTPHASTSDRGKSPSTANTTDPGSLRSTGREGVLCHRYMEAG